MIKVRGSRGLVGWLCLFALWGVPLLSQGAPTPQQAQRGGDFNPASTAWNGLSQFVSEAEKLGLRVETPQRWSWRQARINIPIVMIFPSDEELAIKPLKRFLKAGGRVFLADDFGSSERIWKAFGLEGYRLPLSPKTWAKRRYIDLHRTLPAPYHEADFLLRQASFLFLNVPQWLVRSKRSSNQEPLLLSVPYKSNRPDRNLGGKVLWRISHGRGKLVILSDPSALINQMIVYGDNHRFVRNVLRYLSLPTQAKKVMLLWGAAEWDTTLQPAPPWSQQLSVMWWDAMTDLNQTIAPLPAVYAAYPPLWNPTGQQTVRMPSASWAAKQIRMHQTYLSNRILLFLIVLICLLGTMLRFAAFWNKVESKDIDVTHQQLIEIPHRFDEQIESYESGSLNYMGPLILLKEELILFLIEHFSLQDRLHHEDPSKLGPALLGHLRSLQKQGQLPRNVKAVLPQLERLMNGVPGRHQWDSTAPQRTSAKFLKLYYHSAMVCLRSLGLEESFRASRWQTPPQPRQTRQRRRH